MPQILWKYIRGREQSMTSFEPMNDGQAQLTYSSYYEAFFSEVKYCTGKKECAYVL